MKQGKAAGIGLVVMSVVLGVVCLIFYLREDRTAPGFAFQAVDVIYREGMDMAELLAGVTAYDDTDGDVTYRIVVEKIIVDPEENSAVVFYAVSDRAGNAVRASRVFAAEVSKEVSPQAGVLLKAGVNAELDVGTGG